VLGEEMAISRDELFNHLRTCAKCRQDLFDWQDTYAVMRTEAHFAQPETKKRYAELLEKIKGKVGEKKPIDTKWEIGSAAGTIYRVLKENGEMPIPLLIKKTGLKEYHVQQGIGWLAGQEKIQMSRDEHTAYVTLQPGV
jgi:hypothetical protein